MTSQITMRQILEEDLGRVSEIHMSAFSNSALTKLGHEATRRSYEWQLSGPHPHVVALGCEYNGVLVGFCFGGRFHGALSGFLRRNWPFLFGRLISHPWLLLDKTLRGRSQFGLGYLVTGRFPNKSNHQHAKKPPEKKVSYNYLRSFGINSIAVHQDFQGLGLGKTLMEEAVRIAVHESYHLMHLTVNVSNHQAIRFYENHSWHKVPSDETWSGKMVKLLPIVVLKK